MSLAMGTALSAIMVAQRMSEISSHNIANTNTPGYSRQEGILRPRLPVGTTAGLIGTGVTIDGIRAIRDEFLNLRIGVQKSNLGKTEAQCKALSELEIVIMPGPDAGLSYAIEDFFAAVNELTTNAQSEVAREWVRQAAGTLSETFRSTVSQLYQIRTHLKSEYDGAIDQINSYAEQIANLNDSIMAVSEGTDVANDLIDQRNLLIEDLSQLVPVQVAMDDVVANVLFEGRLIVGGTEHMTVESDSTQGELKLRIAETADAFKTSKGVLGGQAQLYNETVPRYIAYMDELSRSLIREFNAIHATGVGLQNGYTSLTSATELADINLNGVVGDEPLAQQSLAFPPTAGTLYFTVTNDTTGEVQRTALDYDPAVDSVIDIAGKIALIPYMNASVSSGFLTVTAWPDYRFDFSNKLLPDGGTLGGSDITVSGAYTGTVGRAFTFYPMSSGSIGETSGLNIAVIDNDGRFLGLLDVGADYNPGAPLQVADGVIVSFGAGDVQAAQVQTAAEPFVLADGDELTVSIDGGADNTITFSSADFADIANATAYEVAQVINAADAGVKASVVEGTVIIRPLAMGPDGSIKMGGTAAPKLGLTTETISTDSQSIQALGQTDTGGLLTALGLNAFFEGDGGGNICVSEHIQSNLDNMAAAKTSPPGDNANAVLLAQLKGRRVANDDSQTLGEFYATILGKAGVDASQAMRSQETQTKLVESLELQRDAIIGVSLEEEMAKLMQNQQAYYAAVRMIQIVDDMLESLTSL